MSDKVVPLAGNITLRTAPASAGNAIFEVFGTPAGNNLVGLVGSNVDPGTRPPPFTVASTIPTAASGNLKFSFFAGKSAFLAVPTTLTVAAISTTTLTPTLSGGGGTSYQIAIGSSAGTSNTVGWRSATTATQITGLAFTQGSNYYISAYSSNATNSTASLATSNTAAYGIPNIPVTPTITLTSLSNWSIGWTAPAGIAPTTYSYILSNTTDSTQLTTGSTASTSVSGSTTLTQAKNYAVYVSSVRPEASSASSNSANANLAAPGAPTTYTVSTITTSNYTPNVSGGTGSYYVILGTVSGGSTPVTLWSTGTVTQASTVGTSYYLTAITSNTTTGTKSAQFTSAAVGIPNIPVSPTITLTSLTNWSIGWTAPAGIAPTTYSYILSNTTDSTQLTTGSTASTSVSGSTTLTQAKNYAVYVSSVRPEASSASSNSANANLAAPGAPTTYTVSTITTSNYTPNVSGGTGSYYVILGTVSGGSTPVNSWSSGAVTQTSTVGTSYYLTAITSNTTTGTKSAQFTSAAVGIPNPATGVSLTISGLSSWSFSWSAPGTGIAPTGYSWYLNTVNNSIVGAVASGTTAAGTTTTGARTTTLTGGSTYYGLVIATRTESQSTLAASSGVAALAAPAGFTITSMTYGNVNFSWTAVSGASGYTLRYGASSVSVGNVSNYSLGTPFGALYACTIEATGGPASSATHFAAYNTDATFTPTVSKTYTIIAVGGDGGSGYGGGGGAGGGPGGYVAGAATLLTSGYPISFGGGGSGAAPGGGGSGYAQFNTRANSLSLTAGGGGGGGGVDYIDEFQGYATGGGGAGGVGTSGAGATYSGSAGAGATASNENSCGDTFYSSSGGGAGGNAGGSGTATGNTGTGGGGGGGGGGYLGGGGGGANTVYSTGYYARSAGGGGGGASYRGTSVTYVDPGVRSAGAYILIYG